MGKRVLVVVSALIVALTILLWATWHAEKVNGTMVSDRLYYTLQLGIPKELFHSDPSDIVFASQRTEEFTALRDRAVTEIDYRTFSHFMKISEQVFNWAVASDLGMEDPVDGLRRILSSTNTYMGSGLLLAAEKPDLLMVYLEGTDTIGHPLSLFMPPPTLDVDPNDATVYAAAVPKYFELVGRWIGRYLDICPLDEYVVIMVSDHGFRWGNERPTGLSGTAGPIAPMWHARDAVFVVVGLGVEHLGEVATQPSVFDIVPTIADLLGIPPDPSWRTSVLPGVRPSTLTPVGWVALVPPASYRL